MSKHFKSSFPLVLVLGILAIGVLYSPFGKKPPAPSPEAGTEAPRRAMGQQSAPQLNQIPDDRTTLVNAGEPASESFTFPKDENLPADFIEQITSGNVADFTLPDGRRVRSEITLMDRDEDGILFIQGIIRIPEPGSFFFQRQTIEGLAGPFVGNVWFHTNPAGWKIEPTADLAAAKLNARQRDEIICFNYAAMPEEEIEQSEEPENAPQTHPSNIAIPHYQPVIPLQSNPGAIPVIYLDFDGEKGPFPGWTSMTVDAAAANATNSQIYDVWKMVSEDFQGFNLNVTTDRKVFDNAPLGRRAHCIITPTTNAAPGAGGVAYVGSFNWSEDRVCWAYYSQGKSAAEVISHEIGHMLGLSHDGRTSPSEGYYGGHGTDPTGWAPIMGVGYYKRLSQWSKGEYLNANQKQDDLSIIANNNNNVAYRIDDMGDTLATASYLEISSTNSVSNEGIIERTGDIDAFRFVTTGGQATINVNPVSLNPNLDILAEIVNASTSAVVASDNPDLDIKATVSANLPAGEYLLRVRGTGRGDPLGNGYTNYGSLGAYLISGSVTGGIKPERFTIAENSPAGASVGTVIPRNAHAGAALAFAITSGNTGGALAINPVTGAITVANSSVLNYETLSTRWDDPSTIDLFVSITNSTNPELNEILRTVVTVSNLNEAPTVTGGSVTILENTYPGTNVFQVTGSDPDRFDFPTFAITAGNTNSNFNIDTGTGQITVAKSIPVTADTVFNLTIRATDKGSPALTSTANVAVTVVNTVDGYEPGRIVRTYFEGITGTTVASLTGSAKFPNNPDREEYLTAFDGGQYGDNYGSTIRGYVIPPVTGSYRFWIASDDSSQLLLSTNASPANATSRATVSGSTGRYSWGTGTQQSALITLTAGQAYYIEARHKEGGGSDHVSVAWSGPGITKQLLSGLFLAPFYQNYAPKINTATYAVRENSLAGRAFGTVTARDVNAEDTFGAYAITAGNTGGVFGINPASGSLFVAQPGLLDVATKSTYTLTVRTTDNGTPPLNGSGNVTVNVTPATGINVTGIVQEIWTGISGTSLTALTGNSNYPSKPNVRRTHTSFNSGTAYGDNYGSRIRALFVPPTSGAYTFYIASDDNSSLLFSANASGAGASQIASITGYSDVNQWTKFTSQTSASFNLTAGQPVYLETRHKEGSGGDHVSVGYTGPGTTTTTVIPGSMLQPFNINAPPVVSQASYLFTLNGPSAIVGSALGNVTATEPNGETLIYAITSGNAAGAFAIHSSTGAITVASTSALASLGNGDATLQVTVQDGGLGGVYPLGSASTSVVVRVSGFNTAPVFTANPFSRANATEDLAYSATIAGSATDANVGDTLTYAKISGPSWLAVSSTGALSGTPLDQHTGPNAFTVRATDTGGLFAEATLNINVIDVNNPPVITSMPPNAVILAGVSYTGVAAASDRDASDILTFSKSSGPAWLNVAANGSLTGTPAPTHTGVNSFVIRVTDSAGSFVQANLTLTVIPSPIWSNPNGGSWPSAGNWTGGLIANGANTTADFSTLNLNANAAVSLNGSRTVGHLVFGDVSPSHGWTLNPGTSGPLTLAVTSSVPTIHVINQSATLNVPLAGNQGFVKTGSGTLHLTASNTMGGPVSISAGQLALTGSLASGAVTVTPSATLSGTGTINGAVGNFGILSPGSSTLGTLSIANTLTLFPDSSIHWRIDDWAGAAGEASSLLTVNSLVINASETATTTVRVTGNDVAGFTETGKTFTLIKNTGTTTGFDPAAFELDATGFTAGSGTWAIQLSGDDVVLVYTRANTAPAFTTPTLVGADATQDSPYSGTITGTATDGDLEETLTYSKASGPDWLAVGPDGSLSGTPLAADTGTNSFIVRVTDAAGLATDAVLEIEVIPLIIPNPDANDNGILDTWEIVRFGNAEPGNHPADEDPDQDGLSNLMEFALDTHPSVSNASPLIAGFATIGEDSFLQLTVPKNPLATNLTFVVEVCDQPANDTWSATPTVVVSETAAELVVRDTEPVGTSAKRFIRLKVQTSPAP